MDLTAIANKEKELRNELLKRQNIIFEYEKKQIALGQVNDYVIELNQDLSINDLKKMINRMPKITSYTDKDK